MRPYAVGGGVAFGRVYFGGDALPEDASFDDFGINASPAVEDSSVFRFDPALTRERRGRWSRRVRRAVAERVPRRLIAGRRRSSILHDSGAISTHCISSHLLHYCYPYTAPRSPAGSIRP
jgi:hypothetical protein